MSKASGEQAWTCRPWERGLWPPGPQTGPRCPSEVLLFRTSNARWDDPSVSNAGFLPRACRARHQTGMQCVSPHCSRVIPTLWWSQTRLSQSWKWVSLKIDVTATWMLKWRENTKHGFIPQSQVWFPENVTFCCPPQHYGQERNCALQIRPKKYESTLKSLSKLM